jgi:hypothetical protein
MHKPTTGASTMDAHPLDLGPPEVTAANLAALHDAAHARARIERARAVAEFQAALGHGLRELRQALRAAVLRHAARSKGWPRPAT